MKNRFISFLRSCLLFVLILGVVLQPQFSVYALTTLTVTPLTWNVIGLDSNNVNVGPSNFPVGARICNTGGEAATNVTAKFVFDDLLNVYTGDPYINLRSGSLSSISVGTLNGGACTDAYFEVAITRNSGAYNKTRNYHIEVTGLNLGVSPVSSPAPRQIFVEHLVSQNRNSVDNVILNRTTSYAAGATMNLTLGSTYTIELDGHTATQGYNQLEDFINFPNTIFQVLSVQSKYSADSSTFVSNSSDKLYGDACLWDPNPNSTTYRSCIGSDGKIGGTISTVYTIKIIGGVGTTQPLNTLIYDFSGSSYHYNSDYSTSARFAAITSPLMLTKSFSPISITSGGTSTLSIVISNSSASAVTGVSLTDSMPANVTIQGAATSTCGGISNTTTSITLSNATIPTTGCTITATVTSSTNGTYTNTTGDLFINGVDTGTNASANLTVTATVVAHCGTATIAEWTFTGLTTASALPYAAQLGALANSTANASGNFSNGPGSATIDTATGSTLAGGSGAPSWQSTWKNSQNLTEYYVFQVNTSNYTGTGSITFSIDKGNNGPTTAYVNTNTTGTAPAAAANPQSITTAWSSITTSFTAGSTIYLFIQAGAGANNGADDTFNIDDVTFTGTPTTCTTPSFPTIAKVFNPATIGAGGTSTLTFTLTNPNAGTALTQVAFSDPLPSGVQVANPPTASITGAGCTGGTFAPIAGDTSLSLTGLTIPASGSCTVSVKVTAAASGVYNNTTGYISSYETGSNTGASGSASATLTALKPPSIAKAFSPNPIYTGATSTLTFTITNPNASSSLSSVAFSDTFPTGVTVSTAPASPQCGGGTVTSTGNPGSITLANGTLAAGATCTVSVVTTSSTVGSYANTSGNVSAVISGVTYNGNTASDTLGVQTVHPGISILKQVSTSTSGPWSSNLTVATGQNVYYRFTIENTGDVALSPVSITDTTLNVSSCVWPSSLPVGTSSISPTATCTVGPVAAVTGTHSNTATAQGTYSGTVYTSTNSTAVYATTSLNLVKSLTSVNGNAATTSFSTVGDVLAYSYTITNNGATALALLGAAVTDTNTIVTCPATDSSGNHDTNLDQGENIICTATYTVTAFDIAVGSVTNVAYATVNSVKSNNSSVVVYENLPDLVVNKTNNTSGNAITGTPFNWVLTVSNIGPQAATFSAPQLILSDQLPSTGATYGVLAAVSSTNITNPGSISCSIDGSFLLTCSASGATVTIGATTGSFTVTIPVTPTASGSLTNPLATVDPNALVSEGNEGNNTGGDSVTVITLIPPTVSKAFGTSNIVSGGNTNLTVTIGNTNASAITLTSPFTDTFPTGMTINTAGNTGTCTGVTANAGAGNFTIASGTSIPAGGCTVIVNVTSSTAGTATNTIAAGALQTSAGNNASSANASVAIVAPPTIIKSFGTNPIALNGTSVITFTITNPAANTVTLTGVGFTDNYPSGMQNAAVPNASTTCTGGTVTAVAGATSVSLSGASIAVNSNCTVTVTVTATTAGTKTNTTNAVTATGPVALTGGTASASLGVISATKSVVGTSEDSTSGANVAIGEIVRYRIIIDLPEGTTTNLQFVDSIVTNMAYLNDNSTRVAFVCNSGASCASSSTAAIGTNPVISGNASNVTPTFVLPAASITGDIGNPYSDGVDPTFSLGNVTNNDSDLDAEYVVIEFNSIVRNVALNQDGATRGNTFTVNVNGSALTSTTSSPSDQVTIREPAITGTGFTKSITTPPTDAGDRITYQLQITNSGTAPAFDIIITDTLNVVQTTLITVGGSTTGGACGSTASTVIGSGIAPTATATVTCLNPGGIATIVISADLSNTALAGYTFTNSARLTYTSLPGTNGTPNGSSGNSTGSTTPGAAGSGNGERNGSGGTNDYAATSNTVTTTLANPLLAKTINPAGTIYAIGATIPYQITITVPEGVTGSPVANLVDTIPTGLSYVSGSLSVTPQAGVTIGTAGPYTDANASFYNLTGQTLTLTFGSFTSTASAAATNRTIIITFNAIVNNVVGNQSGTTFTNSVDFVRTNPNAAGTLTLSATAPVATVIEPVLAVSKAASTATPAFNSTLTYTLTVSHTGASNAPAYDAVVADTMPAGLTGLTNVNVTSTAPAGCATGVVNNSTASTLSVTIGTIPLACTVTITYDVTVSGAINSTQTNSVNAIWTSQPGSVSGERTGTGGINDYVATTSQSVTVSGPDLTVLKTDGSATYTAGTSISYTITVSNVGNSTATGASVADTIPASITGTTINCVASGTASCGTNASAGNALSFTGVSIPAGAANFLTITVSGTVNSATTANLVNTATAVLGSGTDPTLGNNSSTDTDTPNPQADLAITKTDSSLTYVPGVGVTYTVTVTNNGPSDAISAAVADTKPSQIVTWAWVCTNQTGGASGCTPAASSSSNFSDSVDIPSSGSIVYTVTANIDPAVTGNLVNMATVTAPVGVTDSNLANNTSTDTDTSAASPALSIVKSVTETSYANVGDILHYSYQVTNGGNVTLSGPFTVTDDKSTDESCPATPTTLAPGASITCAATYTVTQVDIDSGSVTNIASAHGSFAGSPVDSATDTKTVNATQTPALTIVKSVTETSYAIIGDVLHYSYQVTNSGNVTLTGPFSVTDDKSTNETCPATATLTPGASIICSATYTVTQADIDMGSVTNVASAHGSFGGNPVDSATDTKTVNATQNPALAIVKSVTETTYANVGDVLHYSYLVRNNGNVTLSGPFTVTDDKSTNETCPATTTLAPASSITCTATYTVTQTDLDAGSVTNIASAHGSFGSNPIDSPNATKTINATQNPALTVVKSVTEISYVAVGDVLHYSYSVTNSGNVTLSGPFTVTDDKSTDEACPATATLAPVASITCTATYTVTQADLDAGSVTNIASAHGSFGGNPVNSAIDTKTVNAIQNPAHTTVKTEISTGPYTVGNTITYNIVITNTGNITLTGVTAIDNSATVGICTPVQPSTLAPNATMTCPATHVVTQADVDNGSYVNTATGDTNQTPPNTSTVTVNFPQNPAHITVKTETSTGPYAVGDTISYNIVVTNTGNITLTNVTVTDSSATVGICAPAQPSTIAPNTTMTCPATHMATQADVDAGSYVNTATGASNQTPPNTSTVTVNFLQNPAHTTVKTETSTGPYVAGDTITYNIVVTNTGNITLTGVTVTDNSAVVGTCTPVQPSSLAPNATMTCPATHLVTATDITNGSYVNTATGDSNETPPNTSTVTITFAPAPALTAAKTETSTGPYVVGDTISYDIVVTNTGNITLTNVTAIDNSATIGTCTPVQPSSLAPNATMTCPATYLVTQTDVDNGSYSNTATGDSNETPPSNSTVTITFPQNPAHTTVKTETSTGPYAAGDTISYNIIVTNTGNITLTGVTVIDNSATVGTCTPAQPASLSPGNAITCPASHVVAAIDVNNGSYSNTATGDTNQTPPSTSTVTVSILPKSPVAQDDSTTTPFNTPVTLPNITANDTAFGAGNSIVINTIDLDPSTAGQQTTFTDANGNQWSVNTTTGDVLFTPATNFTGTVTIPYSVQDASGQTATAILSVTVGPPASISGVVFNDLDLNGTQAAGEPGIGGVKVYLYDSTGTILIASTTTTAGGAYNFPNLPPGDYQVVETDPAGYVSSTSNSVPVTVTAGGSATVNFGDYQLSNTAPSAITGTVYNDVNGNGNMDSGEVPLAGVTVQLLNNVGTVIATTTTNATGGYSFTNLPAGTYTVVETDPVGYTSTTLNSVGVALSSGTTATVNFGDQSGVAAVADPAVTKNGSPSTATIGSTVIYTVTVGNNGNTNATNVVLQDTKPAFLDIISITISPNPGLTPVISGNTFTINFGTVAPTDSYIVTVVTRVNSQGVPPGGSNNVLITTSSGTDRAFNNNAAAALQIPSNAGSGGSGGGNNLNKSLLPATGFAPNIETKIPLQPQSMAYASTNLVLEIPSLGVKILIVGVAQKNGAWDLTWLGKQAGWLAGTAFPSWNGNSVLTGHVYDADGLPGPFANLSKLKYGDKVIVHAYGQQYTFEVRTNQVVDPSDTSAFKHEEKSWLTLVTCKEYDIKTDTYKKRVVVRAVLVRVASDK